MKDNPFLLDGNSRILKWREFRNSLKNYDDIEQLRQIAIWWADCPESFPKLDDFDMKTWPTPWEVLYEGDLCPTSIAYLIGETVELGCPNWTGKIKLVLIKNTIEHIQKMVVVINDEWVLNYNYSNIYEYTKLINECHLLVVHTLGIQQVTQ